MRSLGNQLISPLLLEKFSLSRPITMPILPSLKFITESLKKFVNDKPKKQENDLAFAKSFSCFFIHQFPLPIQIQRVLTQIVGVKFAGFLGTLVVALYTKECFEWSVFLIEKEFSFPLP